MGQAVPGARLLLAGTICERLAQDIAPFEPLGRLAHVDALYDLLDVVVNPMAWGTGLKIKSVEAVFEGLPLIATQVAMIGLPSLHALHALPDAAAVAAAMAEAARSAALRSELAEASRACAAIYGSGVRAAVRDLIMAIGR